MVENKLFVNILDNFQSLTTTELKRKQKIMTYVIASQYISIIHVYQFPFGVRMISIYAKP